MTDFFVPGTTYVRDQPFKAPEINPQFICETIVHHPDTEARMALGFGRGGSMDPWVLTAMEDKHWKWGWVSVPADGASD